MPKNPAEREAVKAALAKIISGEGQTLLGWRDIPTDNSSLGKTAVAAEPHMMQVFIGRNPALKDDRRLSASFTSSASWRSSKSVTAGKFPAANGFTFPACRRGR